MFFKAKVVGFLRFQLSLPGLKLPPMSFKLNSTTYSSFYLSSAYLHLQLQLQPSSSPSSYSLCSLLHKYPTLLILSLASTANPRFLQLFLSSPQPIVVLSYSPPLQPALHPAPTYRTVQQNNKTTNLEQETINL